MFTSAKIEQTPWTYHQVFEPDQSCEVPSEGAVVARGDLNPAPEGAREFRCGGSALSKTGGAAALSRGIREHRRHRLFERRATARREAFTATLVEQQEEICVR